MSTEKSPPTTTHRVRWHKHEELLERWKENPPVHPQNPRYRAYEFHVHGRYSWFETLLNICRDKKWLDPPPAEFKWADVTVFYKAPKDKMERLEEALATGRVPSSRR